MVTLVDFNTPKLKVEFKKAFGKKVKPPRAAIKVLRASLTTAIYNGIATAVTGSIERGLIVKVLCTRQDGDQTLHHIKLSPDLTVTERLCQQNLGAPSRLSTIDSEELGIEGVPSRITWSEAGIPPPHKDDEC